MDYNAMAEQGIQQQAAAKKAQTAVVSQPYAAPVNTTTLNPYEQLQAQQPFSMQTPQQGSGGPISVGAGSYPAGYAGGNNAPGSGASFGYATQADQQAAMQQAMNNGDLSAMAQAASTPAGAPTAPGFQEVYNPLTMAQLPAYEQQENANSAAYNEYVQDATSSGPSAWAQGANAQQVNLAAQDRAAGANEVAGQTAQAQASLASQGGLSSGARERVAEGGAKNAMSMDQGIAQTQNNNDAQIATQDAQNKIGMLGNATTMQQARVNDWENVNNTDTQNQMTENSDINAYNQNLYNQEMSAWAANQQANATANAGK